MKLLWLDDVRDPDDLKANWLVFSPIPRDKITNVVWVKSYNEFVAEITLNGLPDGICFDHDLADEHYDPEMFGESLEEYNELYSKFKEKTGMCAAKWLIDYCISNSLKLPKCSSQSANPIGKENILGILNNFKTMQDNK
jgi:hypothetical protein